VRELFVTVLQLTGCGELHALGDALVGLEFVSHRVPREKKAPLERLAQGGVDNNGRTHKSQLTTHKNRMGRFESCELIVGTSL
jgi:hypothetical protein